MRMQFSPAPPEPTRTELAVRRALAGRHTHAGEEVERILAAAVTVMDRVTPAPPRVSDIVAESGLSNKAFYRYFCSKDDLILAMLERGVTLVASYLERRMAAVEDPMQQVAEWIRGVTAPATDDVAASQSRAVVLQLTFVSGDGAVERELTAPLRRLLVTYLRKCRSDDPERDGDLIFEAAFGTMRRHVLSGDRPLPEEIDHVVTFCTRAVNGHDGRRAHTSVVTG